MAISPASCRPSRALLGLRRQSKHTKPLPLRVGAGPEQESGGIVALGHGQRVGCNELPPRYCRNIASGLVGLLQHLVQSLKMIWMESGVCIQMPPGQRIPTGRASSLHSSPPRKSCPALNSTPSSSTNLVDLKKVDASHISTQLHLAEAFVHPRMSYSRRGFSPS